MPLRRAKDFSSPRASTSAFGAALTFTVLLRALAALMLGNVTNLPSVALSAVALGAFGAHGLRAHGA